MTETDRHDQNASTAKQGDASVGSSTSKPNSLAFPTAGGSSKPLNPAVRRTAEGGRHHQRSHSIDTKDRTSPVLGFGPLQGDIAKIVSGSGDKSASSNPRTNVVAVDPSAAPGREGAAAHSGCASNGQRLQRKASGSTSVSGQGPSSAGPNGLAKPIPRKISNGSSSGSREGSPEQHSPEARRAGARMVEKGTGVATGLGIKESSKRTASPARAYGGKPISPRLSPYAGASGHARRISSELVGPQRIPSPVLLPSSSSPTLPTNPDPQHSWDSVWPRSSTPDRSQQIKRLGSPSSAGSSGSPSELMARETRPSTLHTEHASLLSRSPRGHSDLSGSMHSTSPTIGKPNARRPHELRASSSSPTLQIAHFPVAGKDEVGSPRGLKGLSRPRSMETSKSEPIPRVGFQPMATDHSGESKPSLAMSNAETAQVRETNAVTDEGAAAEASTPHNPSVSKLVLPTDPADLKLSLASPRSPFLRLSSPPATSAFSAQQEMQLAESPPKTRSFIAMPPRSGYELSDDPDDVGSEEEGSSSGQGSVGTNDEDEDNDESEDADRVPFEDDEMGDNGTDSPAAQHGEEQGERAGSGPERTRDSLANGEFAAISGMPPRPALPKRPSLTRSSAVPAPPPVLDPLASVQSSARALAAQKGSEGASLLSYFKDQYEQQQNGSAIEGEHLVTDASMPDIGESQVSDAVQPSALGLDAGLGDAMDEAMGMSGAEGEQTEESLNTLERIFLFAKSEMAYHRVLVASSLPDWIRDVELNDAVEYIIPLLNGLGTDELDVCAAFAPELSRVMWFFFRNCPLAELGEEASQGAVDATHVDASTEAGNQDEEVATRPKISVSTFTSLLCALLLNQNTLIAGATQQSLVQFFCRLENRDLELSKEELQQKPDDEVQARSVQLHMDGFIMHAIGRDGQPVPHEPYDFDERARQAIRNELLDNVAFAIARLSQEQTREAGNQAMDDGSHDEISLGDDQAEASMPSSNGTGINAAGGASPRAEDVAPVQNGLETAVDGMDEAGTHRPDTESAESAMAQPEQTSSNYIEGGSDSNAQAGQEAADTDMMDESQLLESWTGGSSPFAYGSTPNMSDYKADVDEEAAVGRMASVSLLAALSAEELIPKEVLLERTLPEILALAGDPAFYVRKEVAGALGPLAKNLDHESITSKLLPAFETAMGDGIWHVRQAACFSLPAVFGRLDAPAKRERTVNSMRAFVNDLSRSVRLAALEIIGEAIFMFKDDKAGVPDELLRFFVGEPFDGPPQQGDASFSFDQSFGTKARGNPSEPGENGSAGADEDAGDSLLASFGFGSKGGDVSLGESRWETEFGAADTDPERPLVMAFNIPAVVLTLGGEHWSRMRKTYTNLTEHAVPSVRKSLAASLHEIAKIIGPEPSKDDLLPAAERFLGDLDPEVRMAVLENIDVFLSCLPKAEAEKSLHLLLVLWSMEFARDWRLREKLALHIPSMAQQFLLEDEEGNLVSLMQLALADPVSAVRDAGVRCVPDLYRTFAEHDQVIADGFLGMISDLGDSEGYRLRVACLLCIQALVVKGIQRSSCELLLLGRLVQLGVDPVVDVRIALARTVGLMCRRDELYALPQSRSAELNGLLARLGRDCSNEVRQAVDEILSPQEASLYAAAAESPISHARHLVLGPAEGGPHKPEGAEVRSDANAFGENAIPLFDMDEGPDLEDIDMGGDEDGDDASRAQGPGQHDTSTQFGFDRSQGRAGADAGDDSFEEDSEAPHHLLGVETSGGPESDPHSETGQQVISLSSPQRPQQEGEAVASRGAAAGDNNDSPSSKGKAADPFLAFVAGRRSQDLSRLNLNFNVDRAHSRSSGSSHTKTGDGENDLNFFQMAGSSSPLDSRDPGPDLTAAGPDLDDPTEALRSPGSEDGSAGKRSAPSSGDWSQLRGDLPSSQQGGANTIDATVGPAQEDGRSAASDSADEDFVEVIAEETS